jgi:hypothetical protein
VIAVVEKSSPVTTAPRQADRVEPEMASQMNEPSAGHLADFGINAAAQGVIAGLDTVNRVKPV